MDNIHSGHRDRIKNRFIQDSGNLADHELLEMLLYFSIQRKDTNATAHKLIDHFSDLNGVISASYEELCEIEGIGEKSALLIKSVCELSKRYYTNNAITTVFNSPLTAGKYITDFLYGKQAEGFYVFCLNISYNLIGKKLIGSGDFEAVSIYVRQVVKTAVNMNTAYLIIAHNHPGGSPYPSDQDILMTKSLKETLSGMNITLIDHIITSNRSFYSFFAHGEYNSDTPPSSLKNIKYSDKR